MKKAFAQIAAPRNLNCKHRPIFHICGATLKTYTMRLHQLNLGKIFFSFENI